MGKSLFIASYSAFNTTLNSSRQPVVNIKSYAASKMIQNLGEYSPVRIDVVASTMARMAGIEIGNSNRGNIISRARVRNDIAAKNVPLTTSAHVPSPATTGNNHAGPSARR